MPQKADASIWGVVLASYRLHKDIKIAEIATAFLLTSVLSKTDVNLTILNVDFVVVNKGQNNKMMLKDKREREIE